MIAVVGVPLIMFLLFIYIKFVANISYGWTPPPLHPDCQFCLDPDKSIVLTYEEDLNLPTLCNNHFNRWQNIFNLEKELFPEPVEEHKKRFAALESLSDRIYGRLSRAVDESPDHYDIVDGRGGYIRHLVKPGIVWK